MLNRKGLLFVTLLLPGAFSFWRAQEFSSSKQEATISVASFQRERVTGLLGQPLGSVLRVTGVAVDGNEIRAKADFGKTLLKIETVNGEQLATPVYFTFCRAAEGVHKPESGTPFDYYVHEWGSFDGVVVPPIELGIEKPVVANDGFRYRPEVTIHKSNAVKQNQNQQRK
jgi:hypothetical protein